MILLASHCLVFRTNTGESIPYTAESISVQILGAEPGLFDPEFIKNAAAAVFHYYRDELGRDSVTVAEFSLSLERVLRGFKLGPEALAEERPDPRVIRSDLRLLAPQSDAGCELLFFPRLRAELEKLLRQGPQTLCFQGLRQCVKTLSGARRWTPRCQDLNDRIVEFLRSCISIESSGVSCSLLIQ